MKRSGLISPKAVLRTVLFSVVATLLIVTPPVLAQCGPLDVVFVVDTTGSMGGALDNVKAELPSIIAQIEEASGGNYRLGLVEFKDDVNVLNDLAGGNVEAVRNNILGLAASGGSGEPEASDEALRTVIQALSASARPEGRQTGDFGTFRPEAGKIVILITDARPAGFDDDYVVGEDDVAASTLAQEAASRAIFISAVFVPTPAAEGFGVIATVEAIMVNYATVSGGIYIKTESNGTGTADAISEIILNCGGLTNQGFVIFVNPRSTAIGHDGSATFEIQIFNAREFDSDIVLSLADLPEGMTATFTPPVIAAPGTGTSTLRLVPGSTTFPRTHTITIVATGVRPNETLESHSASVQLDVFCDPPFIFGLPENQPQNTSAVSGGSVKLSVRPSGTGPFSYQWYRGPTGSTFFPVQGATLSDFTTPALDGTAKFWVRVTNPCGSADSRTATVTVGSRGRGR